MEEFDIFMKGYDEENTPFDVIELKKQLEELKQLQQKESQKISTPKEIKGVETMRKYCYKRKDGRWEYSRMENGMQFYAIANTYRALVEKIPKIKPKLKITVKNPKATARMSFIQYFEFYIKSYVMPNKKIKQKTKEAWESQLKTHIVPFFKNVPLESLSTEFVQEFIYSINKERTQEILFQKITKVLTKAFVTGKIKKDITTGLEKPVRENFEERNPLTFHEQIQLLKAIKNTRIYVFVIFSIIVGSRREETMRFDLSTDINEKKQTIFIKGTKTDAAPRNVYVTKEFIQFLKSNMKTNTFDFAIGYPTKKIGDIFKKLNIENCLHGLRHTCSANLYFLGASDKYRQLQLGHESIVTTNDIYTNIKENIPKRWLRLIYGKLYPHFDGNFDEKKITNCSQRAILTKRKHNI